MFYIGPATFQVLSSCGYYGDHCHCSCGDRSQILLIREVGEACGKARRLGIDREKGSIKLLGVNPPLPTPAPVSWLGLWWRWGQWRNLCSYHLETAKVFFSFQTKYCSACLVSTGLHLIDTLGIDRHLWATHHSSSFYGKDFPTLRTVSILYLKCHFLFRVDWVPWGRMVMYLQPYEL